MPKNALSMTHLSRPSAYLVLWLPQVVTCSRVPARPALTTVSSVTLPGPETVILTSVGLDTFSSLTPPIVPAVLMLALSATLPTPQYASHVETSGIKTRAGSAVVALLAARPAPAAPVARVASLDFHSSIVSAKPDPTTLAPNKTATPNVLLASLATHYRARHANSTSPATLTPAVPSVLTSTT